MSFIFVLLLQEHQSMDSSKNFLSFLENWKVIEVTSQSFWLKVLILQKKIHIQRVILVSIVWNSPCIQSLNFSKLMWWQLLRIVLMVFLDLIDLSAVLLIYYLKHASKKLTDINHLFSNIKQNINQCLTFFTFELLLLWDNLEVEL